MSIRVNIRGFNSISSVSDRRAIEGGVNKLSLSIVPVQRGLLLAVVLKVVVYPMAVVDLDGVRENQADRAGHCFESGPKSGERIDGHTTHRGRLSGGGERSNLSLAISTLHLSQLVQTFLTIRGGLLGSEGV